MREMGGLAGATGTNPGVQPGTAAPLGDEEQGETASPEEQQIYDDVVARAYMTIFDERTRKPRPGVVKMLADKGDPTEALADVTATIMARVTTAAAEAGVRIPTDVKLEATSEVFSTLAELASKQGKLNFMKDDTAFDAAFLRATNKLQLQEQDAGVLDPAEMEAEFGAMAQAEQQQGMA